MTDHPEDVLGPSEDDTETLAWVIARIPADSTVPRGAEIHIDPLTVAKGLLASDWLAKRDAALVTAAEERGARAAYERGVFDARDLVRNDATGVPWGMWSLGSALAMLDELAVERNPYPS